MKKLLISLFVITFVFGSSIGSLTGMNRASAQQKPIPPYAKWGTLALQKTHEKYPHAEIIDYLHIGRTSGPQTSTEKFKLWLKDNNKEFGVFVNIEFNKETEKVVKVTFQETSR
ncbi:YqzG/YhdC family protein [Neobacillus drentensis]|uniref:YqzG/YhdC family protein n=1 Tax=Neobacillus drentensis TaxID=220684 RepID=UPI002FFE24A1